MLKFISVPDFNADLNICFLTEDQVKSGKLNLNSEDKKSLNALIKKNRFFKAKAGESSVVPFRNTSLCLIGLGCEKDLTPTQLRTVIRNNLISHLTGPFKSILIIPHNDANDTLISFVEAVNIGTYVWDKYKTSKNTSVPLYRRNVLIVGKRTTEVTRAIISTDGVNLARDLVNENADICNSLFIESIIKQIIRGKKNIRLSVFNDIDLKRKGLGLHLAVNQGSANPAKLIIVEYNGDKKRGLYTGFVGKGLTFDTGGLNLKPTGSIETMKIDMGGCAAVIGTLKNIIALNVKKNILFVCAVAENVTGSKSYKPGDVLLGYAKKSVEVLNTDAEGRLVLADAMAYIIKNYKIKNLIDVATLTGACVVALGHDYTGLMTNDDSLAESILLSAARTDDRAWRLPLYPELKTAVSSQIADIANLGSPRGAGGAITAAEFLRQFVGTTSWAHLDIAGTAYVDSAQRMYFGHGATGAGVRLMTDFLSNN